MMNRLRHICRRLSIISLISLVFLIIPAYWPDRAFPEEGAIMKGGSAMWPAEMNGWKITEGPVTYDSTTAYKYMNGAAELFIAFNMRTLNVLKYEKAGQPAITLEIFRMASSEDAYGIFSFESDDPKGSIGQGSEFGGGLLRFWKGRHFVSIYGDKPGAEVEKTTLRLGEQVASSMKAMGDYPKILRLLPDGALQYAKLQAWFLHSHILLNQRFFVAYDNILNLSGDVKAALGRYGSQKEKIHLLLIEYPSVVRADEAFGRFNKAYLTDAAGKVPVKTENNKWTAAEKRGSYLVIVFDAPDSEYALKIVELTTARLREGK